MVCEVCGCTDDNPCVGFLPVGDGPSQEVTCSWVAPGLCSGCAPPELETPEPLLFDASGAPLVFK